MKTAPYWPRLMKRRTACQYTEMTLAEFEGEIAIGRMPQPVLVGNEPRWSRAEIDQCIERMSGESADWRASAPMYQAARHG